MAIDKADRRVQLPPSEPYLDFKLMLQSYNYRRYGRRNQQPLFSSIPSSTSSLVSSFDLKILVFQIRSVARLYCYPLLVLPTYMADQERHAKTHNDVNAEKAQKSVKKYNWTNGGRRSGNSNNGHRAGGSRTGGQNSGGQSSGGGSGQTN
ncbi:hypothetical protein J7T55_000824 [Diaporthe amygdali]|uniref:uncharacterized protein n=1 Tax=Phomopsis amygdali TaxID=1214568 RepID=UPI0022FF3609|nr:uncharacterized protein J7T55_000824 [Diaporthe amygdali]KAJ0119974.1 hypothetical protein J7T55_000824 [Diaporthe amygdali]